jgi:hypothetical protein
MPQTIEVEIDAEGHIQPLEKLPLHHKGKTRALLTILPDQRATRAGRTKPNTPGHGVLTATRSVTLDDMDAAIRARGINCDRR